MIFRATYTFSDGSGTLSIEIKAPNANVAYRDASAMQNTRLTLVRIEESPGRGTP